MIKSIFILIVALVICGNVNSQQKHYSDGFIKTTLSQEIEKMREESGIPSISITIIRNGKILWNESFGYSNMKLRIPATINTLYSTGSTVKPFLAVSILQLVEKGILDLDEPVNNYLKNPIRSFSDTSKPITLRHLLSHQSGIPASAEFVPLWGNNRRKTLQEIASTIKPIREPEKQYEYANDGFVIAALVVEEVTGINYASYVNKNILAPLGLSEIKFSEPTAEMVEEMALPYKLVYNKALPIKQQYSQPFPGGGMTYISPSQMSRFLIAILNSGVYEDNRILNVNSIEELKSTSFGHEYYGLGIGFEKINNNEYWFHNGLQEGYTASFKLNINSKNGVYIMSNTIAEQHLVALTDLAMDILDGKEDYKIIPSFATKEYTEIELSESNLERFVGIYQIKGTEINLAIEKIENRLFLKNPANLLFEIVPYEQDKFFLKTEEEQIMFVSSGNEMKELILYSDGQEIQAEKIK